MWAGECCNQPLGPSPLAPCSWELPWANSNPWQLVGLVVHGGRLPIPPPEELRGPDALPPQLLDDFVALIR